MRSAWKIFERYAPWLLLLLAVDAFSILLLWLSDVNAFLTLAGLIISASVVFFSTILLLIYRKERHKTQLFQEFLTHPDNSHEEQLLRCLSQEEGSSIRLLACVLRQQQLTLSRMAEELGDYEEYVEGWAHEAKTPLSLLTMLLDNHGDEIPSPLRFKLDYVRSQLQEDITQMLYYARLKGPTKDYLFEAIDLHACIEEVLENYTPLLVEKGFIIQNRADYNPVYTDRRGIQFMLGQIISNAIKYSKSDPTLEFSLEHTKNTDILRISDHGIGVKAYDLPYIFQKGFTGDSTDSRKKATGMGLYLTKKMADDLNLRLEASSDWGIYFEMAIFFPK